MPGHRKFTDLTRTLTPEARQRVEARKAALRREMPLHELRRARALTQQELARTLNVGQPAVAKLERRADAYISNLRAFIEAMGGSLRIVASFPEGEVEISNFAGSTREENQATVDPVNL